MRVLIADKYEAEGVALLEELGCEVNVQPTLEADGMPAAFAEFKPDVLIVRSTKVPAAALDAAGDLKLIIRAGAGYDNIDWKHAAEIGIAVSNTPGMNADAVAELAMGLLIASDRRIPQQTAELAGGHWFKKEFAKARGLKGRTLLVMGAGAIGFGVAKRAMAFGMHVMVLEPTLSVPWAKALGLELVSPDGLLDAVERADAISIHVPANEHTKGMVNDEFFARVKPGAIIVNTSRGPIIDDDALLKAIETKGVRAGIDVYNNQPAGKDEQWKPSICDNPNIVNTHHIGASTDQAQIAVAEEAARIVQELQGSGKFLHCVNAETLKAPAHA